MSEFLQPPEPLPPDDSLAARLEEMRAAHWAVDDIVSDIVPPNRCADATLSADRAPPRATHLSAASRKELTHAKGQRNISAAAT